MEHCIISSKISNDLMNLDEFLQTTNDTDSLANTHLPEDLADIFISRMTPMPECVMNNLIENDITDGFTNSTMKTPNITTSFGYDQSTVSHGQPENYSIDPTLLVNGNNVTDNNLPNFMWP